MSAQGYPPPVQLAFGGGIVERPRAKPRSGCIGKIVRLLATRPWLTCGEIAQAIGEPSGRVSECLNKLKHEGAAQQVEKLGPSNRNVWADTDEDRAELRERELRRVTLEQQERVLAVVIKKAKLAAEPPDWRPEETIAEDHYAR